ncbi:hypothetical protein KEM56_006365, partial [Ascosphaera pollenicola]
MAAQADLETLRGLFQDLSSLSKSALPNLERLVVALEATIGDFRNLLDKPVKSNKSRREVQSGQIKIDDVEYEVNSEFQQDALQIADALNLDELQAAQLYLAAQQATPDSSAVMSAIIRFHERRAFLLECLRLIFSESFDSKDDTQALMQDCVAKILDIELGPKHASVFMLKCLNSLADIEHWLVLLGEQLQKAALVGTAQDTDIVEVIEYQRQSLERQHESLAIVVSFLFKGTFTSSNDLRELLGRLQKFNKIDVCLIHHFPAIIAAIAKYGSPEGQGSQDDANAIYKIITTTESSKWLLPKFHAAVILLWLSEYSGWSADAAPSAELEKAFKTALDDGALEFILALCARAHRMEEIQTPRSELVTLLLKDDDGIPSEPQSFSDTFFFILMDSVEMFTQSLISNLPDAIRHLKAEEDSQRLDQITALREGLSSATGRSLTEMRMYFESLLVIMAFAFDKREEAAQAVWAEPDGNMYGFLSFTSKRQTVPTASAFCELLCSLSQGEENALSTHLFLQEEDNTSAKYRRPCHMGWNQMLQEFTIYAAKASHQTTPAAQSVLHIRPRDPTEIDEPESPVMLTSYLRLISHICGQSYSIRAWLTEKEGGGIKLVATLLELASATIPGHLRAAIFLTLKTWQAKEMDNGYYQLWTWLEWWVSVNDVPSQPAARGAAAPSAVKTGEHTFQKILETFDQTNAFIELISALMILPPEWVGAYGQVSFPSELGSSSRQPGVEPYIDFVMGQAFAVTSATLPEAEARQLQYTCLNFAAICLESFNEGMTSEIHKDDHKDDLYYRNYIHSHPFARVMEWFFNEDVLKVLFSMSHQDIREVEKSSPNSILALSLGRALHVMNLVLNLQTTYMDVVRPYLKSLPDYRAVPVATSSLSCFEESVMDNLTLISDLCIYAGALHPPLTLVSLSLLENIATSRKLSQISATIHGWQLTNPLVEIITSRVEVDRLASTLSQQLRVDIREIESGPSASGYLIKSGLAHLLSSCLKMSPNKPNIAHALLGFTCSGSSLDAREGFASPTMSLLRSIVTIAQAYPVSFDGINIVSWMVRLKRLCFQVVKQLYSSKLTSTLVLPELRAIDVFTSLFLSQPPVNNATLWDDKSPSDLEFWQTDSALAFSELLAFRAILFNFAATDLRYTAQLLSPSFVKDLLNTALGTTAGSNNQTIQHASLFDLFDFAEINVDFDIPFTGYMSLSDFDPYLGVDEETELPSYDLQAVCDHIDALTSNAVASAVEVDEVAVGAERDRILLYCKAFNQSHVVRHNRYLAIRAWTELAATIVLVCDMDTVRRSVFMLHVLQAILPKLEAALAASAPEAIELAKLAETLMEKLGATNDAADVSGGNIIDERLNSLFQACIGGVPSVLENTELRSYLYGICARYLKRITNSGSSQCEEAHQVVQAAGPAVIATICDDAYTGEDGCRVSALIFLELLTALDRLRSSSLIIDSMTRQNHLAMFVDVVRTMPEEFRHAETSEVQALLVYYQTHLAFLFGLARTRIGAERLLEAGLFQAVRDSQLFIADPDIGI